MIKGSIQEDTTIVNIYAPNIGAPQYIRQMLTAIKGEINSNTIIVGDINTLLSSRDRSSKMKINKETHALMIRRPPRSTPSDSSAASDVYKRQLLMNYCRFLTLCLITFALCIEVLLGCCLLYTSPSPRDRQKPRMPSSA